MIYNGQGNAGQSQINNKTLGIFGFSSDWFVEKYDLIALDTVIRIKDENTQKRHEKNKSKQIKKDFKNFTR